MTSPSIGRGCEQPIETRLPGAEECMIIRQRLTAQRVGAQYLRGDIFTAAIPSPNESVNSSAPRSRMDDDRIDTGRVGYEQRQSK
jgi:hypothetical protein